MFCFCRMKNRKQHFNIKKISILQFFLRENILYVKACARCSSKKKHLKQSITR